MGCSPYWGIRKNTVDESITINLSKLKIFFLEPSEGIFVWSRFGGYSYNGKFGRFDNSMPEPRVVARVEYKVIPQSPAESLLALSYTVNGSPQEQNIGIVSTRPSLGGLRWWLSCPRCQGKAYTLHLPPGDAMFACRGCHDLTYLCSQQNQKFDSLLTRLGVKPKREQNRKGKGEK